ncbi:MAG: SDR family NAD(P)-dependent oxidoreductase [Chloroflexi bacterium]|nr:SDR family NAD(P)-dependent oxidoreductase [Chloroflexota bacterium]
MNPGGRTVIVTGASSGIGRETSREFARAGANVVLASRNKERLDALAEELSPLPGKRLVVPTDVREREAVEAMVARAAETFSGVDVLVNNAGLGLDASIAEGSLDNMRYVFDVNLFGYIYAVRAVVPHMRKQGRGIIVNVSSVAGRISTPYNGVYSATKASINSVSDALRLELAEDGIKVITIYPGFTVTGFRDNSLHEVELPAPSRMLQGVPALAVGRKIVQAVRREKREAFVTFGDAAGVMVKNLAPRLVDWGIKRFWLASRKPAAAAE